MTPKTPQFMLRKNPPPKASSSHAGLLTPMVDVLFLLVFFLVLGASFESLEGLQPPKGSAGKNPPVKALLVLLHANGNLSVPSLELSATLAPGERSLGLVRHVVNRLRQQKPPAVLLTPDENVKAKTLLRWHQTLKKELQLPIWIGLSPSSKF